MKWLVIVCAVVAAVAADLAEPCDPEVCLLPDCRCSSTSIPGGLLPRETPQLVTFTFDDAITVTNIETYRRLLYRRRNMNNCPIGATFYMSHEWSQYQFVNELYNNGFQIALHSISHRVPQDFWRNITYDDLVAELVDQRRQISAFANIPESDITGVRLPFLQLNGNTSYQVIVDHNLGYDSSWSTTTYNNPGLWPYTLDYASTQDCFNPPCPTSSIPGSWVFPMVSWVDLAGYPCAMVDSCPFPPQAGATATEWFQFFVRNFERHYLTNRSPFPFFIHEGFIRANPAVMEATIRFLDLLNNLHDVYMVNHIEVLNWIRNPVPINEYRQQPCRSWIERQCEIRSCGAMTSEHNGMTYYPTTCNICPRVYPWVGNPLGQ